MQWYDFLEMPNSWYNLLAVDTQKQPRTLAIQAVDFEGPVLTMNMAELIS
jgi:hypothetical protein